MLALDQLTKQWALTKLEPLGSIKIIPGLFSLTYVGNTGVAWNDIGAAAVAAMLPPMLIFLVMGRYVVRGLTFGSLKG